MSTSVVILTMILALALCGTGPSLLLLPRGETALRVLATLPLGLSTAVVASMGLAWLGLTGRRIATTLLVLFAALAAAGLAASPPTRRELRHAVAPILIAAVGMLLATWPLLQATHYRYVGYGNADAAILLRQAMYLDGNPFGMYPDDPEWNRIYYHGVQPQLMLGMLYTFSMVSLLTGAPIHTLFGVACASMVFTAPLAVYVLAEDGFRLPRSTALLAALVVAGSSLLAYTFYLYSLGTLTVMVILPTALAFMALCVHTPSGGRILLVALLWTGMFYNYHAGSGLVGISLAVLTLHALWTRRITFRTTMMIVGACSLLTLSVFLPHGLDILKILQSEVTGGRRLAWNDEIQGFFALTLTEHFLPFLWGLKLLTQPPATLVSAVGIGFLAVGLACVALVIAACNTRVSRLPGSYAWIVAAIVTLILAYAVRSVGYGVFKLAAWAHPVLMLGFVSGAVGLSQQLRRRMGRLAGMVPIVLLAGVIAWNGRQTLLIANYTDVKITSGVTLEDYAQLRSTTGLLTGRRILALLPDPVSQSWVAAFLPEASLEFLPRLPRLTLAVSDSQPMAPETLARYVTSSSPDEGMVILHHPSDAQRTSALPQPLWSNSTFTLSLLSRLQDILVFGRGWYRLEESDQSPFPFVRHFRWLRKRGEFLVLNGHGEPRRLRLKLAAGFGNSDPVHRLRVYHNGTLIDELRFLAYAQLYTRPFRLEQPLEQIELEVVGDASPLPRPSPLWNAWVPRDPRRLNVAVAGVELVTADAGLARMSQIDFTDRGQVLAGTFEGIHRDRWMGAVATVILRVPPGLQAIELRGSAPMTAALSYPVSIRLRANGDLAAEARITKAGDFQMTVPIDGAVRDQLKAGTDVVLALEAPAGVSNHDPRPLSIRLGSLALVPVAGQGAVSAPPSERGPS